MPQDVKEIILSSPVHIFSFGFGAGFSPVAPGTVGTLFAVPLYLVLVSFSSTVYISCVVVLFIAGCWSCKQTAEALSTPDPPGVVIDEIVGYLVAMLFVPFEWYWVLAGFLLFRLFDIWKPWPVSLVDRHITGGLGIMLDDVVAAFYSLLCIHGLIWIVFS